MQNQQSTKRFRVALSFPGEHRDYVSKVAKALPRQLAKDEIFYDEWHKDKLARPNLDTYLQNIYHNESDLVVVFLCQDYVEKEWCGLEFRAIRDLIKKRQDEDIMPMRFDDADVGGILGIDGYIDLRQYTPEQAAEFILQRLPPKHPDNSTDTTSQTPTILSDRLPTVAGKFFGRKEELQLLDDAWRSEQTNIVEFVASGGTGKTKLLRHWLDRSLCR